MNAFKILEMAIRRHIAETNAPGLEHNDYAHMWGCLAPVMEDLARDNQFVADRFLELADEFMYTRENRAEEILFGKLPHGEAVDDMLYNEGDSHENTD